MSLVLYNKYLQVNHKNYVLCQKFDYLDSHKVSQEIFEYLVSLLSNLDITICGQAKENIIDLMFKGSLGGWCWETTNTSILFFDDDAYINRGNLIEEDNTRYYHSWIVFNYMNEKYVFDPCFKIICKNEFYEKIYTPEIKGSVRAEQVKSFFVNYIKQYLANNENEVDKNDMGKQFLQRMFGEYLKQKKDIEIIGDNDPASPMYRNRVGYEVDMENDKVKKDVSSLLYDVIKNLQISKKNDIVSPQEEVILFMTNLDILKITEQRLGRQYSEWTDLEKIDFALHHNIGQFKEEINSMVMQINSKVELLKNAQTEKENNSKIDRYVNLCDILSFIHEDYTKNVWDGGISKLKRKVRKYLVNGRTYRLQQISLFNMNNGVLVQLDYEYRRAYDFGVDVTSLDSSFAIHKKNNSYYISTNDFDIKWQKVIFDTLNCQKIFDYFQNIENCTIKGIYNYNGSTSVVPIELGYNYLCIGSLITDLSLKSYNGMMFRIPGNSNGLKEEQKFNNLEDAELKSIYFNDPDYLEHIVVNYNDLPIYIQEKMLFNSEGKVLRK